MTKHLYILILLFFAAACVKDKPNNTVQPVLQLSSDKKVYVVNEGNFMAGNASVSLYDPGTNQVIEDFYKAQNNLSLGDVAQSITSFNTDFYVVVNNSNKIVVCNDQFKFKTVIAGFTSPRYLIPVSNSKAYVSDYLSNCIWVVNLNSNSITTSIPCSGWTEKMVLIYNKVFVTNMKKNFVYVINTVNDSKTDSINVGPNAGNIITDKNDNIWVLSSGDKPNSVNATLKKINPVTNTVESTLTFNSNDAPGYLCINKTKDTLYFLNNGIYKMPVTAAGLPSVPFINGGNNFYGLGINPNDYTIYAADALDYIQKSNIYIFYANGNQKTMFKAGINSNGFYFE
jgi:YVTN family beta-propeller protein